MTVSGPKRYDRYKGAPNLYNDTFERCEPSDLALLRVTNGNGKDTSITSGQISINGTVIVSEEDFKQQTFLIEKPIVVQQHNEIKVELKSSSRERSFVIVEIVGKNCDSTAPVIFAPTPAEGALLNISRPLISASYRDEANGSGIDPGSARLTLDGVDVTADATVTMSGITYLPATDLSFGEHEAVVFIGDRAANSRSHDWRFTIDTIPPEFKITSPVSGSFLNTQTISIFGDIKDPTARVTLNGAEAQVVGEIFSLHGFSLIEGSNNIVGTATDLAGNPATATITVILDTHPPEIVIASPANEVFVNTPKIDVSGSVDDVSTKVSVNGIAATVSGKNFALAQFQLLEGSNLITVEAEDRATNKASADVRVNLDTVTPELVVVSPFADSWVNTPLITVGGTVKETNLEGLWINDAATPVSFDSFSTSNFQLVEGSNQIKVLALDKAGNEITILVPVNLDTVVPSVAIAAPIDNFLTNNALVTVSGAVSEEFTVVTVNNIPATVTGKSYVLDYTLTEGSNSIVVRTTDRAGNTSVATITVTLDSIAPAAPVLNALPSLTNIPTVNISGTAEANSTVKIFRSDAVVGTVSADAQGNFFLANVTLLEVSNTFTATATDAATNESAISDPVSTVLDSIAPAAPVLNALQPLTNISSVNVGGTAEANSTVKVLKSGAVIGTVTADAQGNFTLTNVALTEGGNSFTATATDAATNQSEVSAAVTTVLDSIAPDPPRLNPLPLLTNVPTVNITGTAEANSTVKILKSGSVVGTVTADAQGNLILLNVSLTEGNNGFTATATDAATNQSGVSAVVGTVLDSVAPAAPVLNALPLLTNVPTVNITGTAEANSTVKILKSGSVIGTVTADAQGNFVLANTALTEGNNSFTATATDAATNQSAISDPVGTVLDSIAPAAPVLNALQPLTNVSTGNISGTAEANSTVKILKSGSVVGTVTADAQGNFVLANVSLTEGNNSFTATATDAATNQSAVSAAVTTVLDSIAPDPPRLNPLPLLTNAPTVNITGTAEANSTVKILKSGSVVGTVTADAQGNLILLNVSLTEGNNGFTATATDAATNQSGVSAVVGTVLDSVAPAAPVLNALPLLTNVPTVNITGTAEANSTVKILKSGSVVGTVTADAQGNFVLANTALTEGNNSFTATATDAATNESAVSAPVATVLDSIAPAAPVLNPLQPLTNISTVNVRGTAEANSTVNILKSGAVVGTVTADVQGNFILANAALTEGGNSFTVTATDAATNESPASPPVSTMLDSIAPDAPVLNALPALTNIPTVNITGTAEANSIVKVFRSDAVLGTVSADAQGNFVLSNVTLLEGGNTFTATATDAATNQSAVSAAVTTVLDSIAPAVPILNPLQPLTNISTVNVSGTAEANSTVKILKSGDVVGSVMADAQGNFVLANAALTEGNNSFTATATDAATNQSGVSAAITTVLDSIAPAAPVLNALQPLTNISTVNISGTAEANSTVKILKSGAVVGTVTADAQGSFILANAALTEGNNSFAATATDAATNESAISGPVTTVLDSIAPAAPILNPLPPLTNISTVNVSGSAEANSTVRILKSGSVVGTVTADAQGNFILANAALTEGGNTFTATATDAATNESAASAPVTTVLDSIAPAAPILSALPPLTNVTTVNISSIAEANSNVKILAAGSVVGTATADAQGNFVLANVTLVEGNNSFTATATDAATNESAVSAPVTTVLDSIAPAAPVLNALPSLTNVSSVNISGTAEANADVKILAAGSVVGTVKSDAQGNFILANVTLVEGSNSFTATATDAATNQSAASAAVTTVLDSIAPAAPVLNALPSLTNVSAVNISGTAETNSTVKVLKSGAVVGTVTADAQGNFVLANVTLTEGSNSFTATATDAATNQSAVSAAVTTVLDSIAPAAPVLNALPSLTNVSTLSITGTAEANSTVKVLKSGAVVGTVTADAQGNFVLANVTLVEGSNSFTATATDAATNQSAVSAAVTTVLDSIAPAAPVLNALPSLTNISTVSLSGTAEAASTVKIMAAGATVGTAQADAQGNFVLANVTLVEGNNSFTAAATDAATNESAVSAPVTTVLDSIAPAAPVLAALLPLTNISSVNISGTAEANSAVKVLKSGAVIGTVTADAQGSFLLANVALTEGDNSFTATATDAATNESSVSAPVTTVLDSIAPAAPVLAALQSLTNVSSVNISGTAEANSSVKILKSGSVVGTVTADAQGNFTLANAALTEGNNSFTATATDAATNESAASTAVTTVLDSIAPAAPVLNALQPLVNVSTVSISGTAEANSTVKVIKTGAVVGTATADAQGNFVLANVALTEGDNSFTATATDAATNESSVSAPVTTLLDSIAPVAPVLNPLITPTNITKVTISGSTEAGSTVKIYSAAVLIGTVTADTQGSFTLPDVTLTEGDNSFTATATDIAVNTSGASDPVIVNLDIVPPTISVTAPLDNAFLSEATVSVIGSINEDVSSFTINGHQVGLQDRAFQQAITLTPSLNSIVLAATDLAGNPATKTVLVTLDSTPPVVTISAPASGAITNAPQVTVTGSISKPHTTATINGTEITVTDQSFSVVYMLQEGENTLKVEATDRAGNKGSASVARNLDTQLPVVSVETPAEAAAGANVAIALSASDNSRLTLVELKADGVPIWSGGNTAAVAESVAYRLSPTLSAGGQVLLQAKGTDTAGNIRTASATIAITGGAAGPGYLQGKVLDDTRGLRMEGATVSLTGAAGTNLSLASATDGGYFAEAAAGQVLVNVSKPGYTTVERTVAVLPEKKASAIDARLTKINTTANLVGAAGATVRVEVGTGASKPAVELEVPAGAIAAPSDLRLTPISNQGLAGLLPAGWSPLAVVDLRLLDPNAGTTIDAAFAAAAALKIPLTAALVAPEAVLTLAVYDATAHQWQAKGNATLAADSLSASSNVDGAGQYALVIADSAPNAPAAAAAGSPLAAATSAALDYDTVNAQGRVVPQAAPPATGLKAAGEVVLSANEGAAAPSFTSGLVLNSRITENFDLKSGDSVQTPSYTQDIVLYSYPCLTSIGAGALSAVNAGTLRTTFPVSPSKDYTIVELLLGKVGLEITVPEAVETGVMVGPDGGRLVDVDGNILAIPQGALSQTVPVSTKNGAAATGVVGADFNLLKVVEVNVTGQVLAQTAVLSIAAPETLDPSLPLILARQIEVKGVAKLKLVALVKQSGTMLSSDTILPGATLAGLTGSGNYYFLQAKGPLGFLTGTVTDASANSYTGALVKTAGGSLVDLTPATGKYLLAAPVAPVTATATDLYKNDEVSGSVTLSANAVVTLDLKILMLPPTLKSVTPSGINVQPSAPVVVTFSKSIDKASVSPSTIKLTDASGNVVAGVFTFSVDAKVVTFSPNDLLASEQSYTVRVDGAIKDLQGYLLASDSNSSFTVRKTTPPPMPPAGAVSGTFPDVDGFITVTATQGSAETGNTVLLINDSTGEIVSVAPASNGSFTGKIRGQLGDEIQVVLMDYSGNRTLISYLTFKSEDGKYLVTAKGGRIEGEGGSLLQIPEGALSGPAVVKVTTILEAQLPSVLQEPGSYLGAVNIDTGGASFRKAVEVSIPMPSGFDQTTPVFITTPSQIITPDETDPTQTNTENVYQIIDSTKIVGDRISSACPPFDGVWGGGPIVFTAFVDVTPVVVSGYAYQERNDIGGYQPAPEGVTEVPIKDPATGNLTYKYDRPVPRAVLRAPSAWNYISYTNGTGFYGTFAGMFTLPAGFDGGTNCMGYRMTATHPATMFSHTFNGYACAKPYNVVDVNFKLAEKATLPPDRDPPVINISSTLLPDQGSATYIDGNIEVGTELAIAVTVTDAAMGTANLSAEWVSQEDGTTNMAHLSLSDPTLTNMVSLIRYSYVPNLGGHSGSSTHIFKGRDAGLLRLIVDARDDAGNATSKSLDIRVVIKGEQPTGMDGAPRVTLISPPEDNTKVLIDQQVKVVFSEGVTGVSASTFTLFDVTANQPVPATVSPLISNGFMKGVLTPRANFAYGHTYRASLSTGIKDVAPNPSAGGGQLSLLPVSWQFTTTMPAAAELDSAAFGARDIDQYYDSAAKKRYAYVAAGTDGWRVVDVTKPEEMAVVWPDASIPAANFQFSSSMDYRHLDVDQETARLAITDNYKMGITETHYGYIRFYSLANPKIPVLIGREKLAEAMSGVPLRVSILNGYAYVCTVGVGVQIVDIDAAVQRQQAGGASNGSSIKGYFDTNEPTFYGTPTFFEAYRPTSALLTTTLGKLLTLDLSIPTMPTLITSFQPEDAASTAMPRPKLRFGALAAVPDFSYRDNAGSLKMMDVAVAGVSSGGVRILDVTVPADPKVVGVVKNQDGSIADMVTRDITVNIGLGLAIAPALDALYVIDINNPYEPRVLNKIAQVASSATNPDGTPVMINLDSGQAIVEKNGQVYLASPATATNGISPVKVINLGGQKKNTCYQVRDCDP